MKKIIAFLCIFSLLFCSLTFSSCAPILEKLPFFKNTKSTLPDSVKEKCPEWFLSIIDNPYTNLPEINSYEDRLTEDLRPYYSLLNERQKELYNFILPYFLSFSAFELSFEASKKYEDIFMDWVTVVASLRQDYYEVYWVPGKAETRVIDNIYYSVASFSPNLQVVGVMEQTFDENFSNPQDWYVFYTDYLNQESDKILADMPQGLNTREKYIWIADYMCALSPEGETIAVSDDCPALFPLFGLSSMYSFLYQWLCARAGLWCLVNMGDSNNENNWTWNIVMMDDGTTYYMDVTLHDWKEGEDVGYLMTYDEYLRTGILSSILNYSPEYIDNWRVTGRKYLTNESK